MEPRDFYKVAVELSRGNTRAHQRSAISRAYYAVFNSSVEHLRRFVPISRGPAAHGEAQRCLVSSGDSEISTIGGKLQALHSLRIRANYRLDMNEPEIPATVKGTLLQAEEMLSRLDAAFTGPKASQLRDSIQKYWREVLRKLP